jgi:ATP-binding cassette subfamily F protein uup
VPNLISVERASLALGTTQVLDAVSLGLGGGDRIGIVGRNGGGKTTLLRVLSGTRTVDSGRVARVGGLTVGTLSQDDTLDPTRTVHEVVLRDLPEHEWAADPRIRDILEGLLGGTDGAGVGGLDATIAPLSGGERRRIALAALLVQRPDVLLLDEPTNHLDVEGVAWLADHLVRRHSSPTNAILAITHDRWFLDAVAGQTWEVENGAVHAYEGGYAAFVLAKAERSRIAAVTADRRDNLLRKELAWLRRGAPARTSKPKFRIEAANALIAAEPPPRDDVELVGFATSRLGKDVIDLQDASVEVAGRALLDRVTWHLAPGERIGIVGVNGAGKSTLLRVLAGEVPLSAGKRKVGVTVQMAHLTQEVRELEEWADRRVIEAVEAVKSTIRLGRREISASQLAQRLGFTGPRQQTRVRDLSGGERRRLQLTRLLMSEPNVLLLDEPTNDLDIETLTSLEDVLDGWAGTLLVVSHDRYLLERVCDRQVALLGDGKVRDLPGGVEQYLRLRAASAGGPASTWDAGRSAAAAVAAAAVAADSAADGPGSLGAAGGGRTASASSATPAAPAVSPAQAREARKTMARVEKQLSRLADREEKLHAAMLTAATDHARVLVLNRELREIVDEREDLELQWLEAAESSADLRGAARPAECPAPTCHERPAPGRGRGSTPTSRRPRRAGPPGSPATGSIGSPGAPASAARR